MTGSIDRVWTVPNVLSLARLVLAIAVFVIVRLPEQAHAALASLPALDGEDSRPAFVITTLRSDDAAELPDHAAPGWRPTRRWPGW